MSARTRPRFHEVEIHTPINTFALMEHQTAAGAQRAYDERHIAQEVSGDYKARPITTNDRIMFERGLMAWEPNA